MAKSKERKIHRAVRVGRTVYGPGREDELLEVLPKEDVERLSDNGTLGGDWSGAKGKRGPAQPRHLVGQAGQIDAGFQSLADALRATIGGGGSAGSTDTPASGAQSEKPAEKPAGGTTEPPRAGEVRAPFDPETYSLNDLPKELAKLDDPAQVGALRSLDTRKGAVEHYNQRLDQLNQAGAGRKAETEPPQAG